MGRTLVSGGTPERPVSRRRTCPDLAPCRPRVGRLSWHQRAGPSATLDKHFFGCTRDDARAPGVPQPVPRIARSEMDRQALRRFVDGPVAALSTRWIAVVARPARRPVVAGPAAAEVGLTAAGLRVFVVRIGPDMSCRVAMSVDHEPGDECVRRDRRVEIDRERASRRDDRPDVAALPVRVEHREHPAGCGGTRQIDLDR